MFLTIPRPLVGVKHTVGELIVGKVFHVLRAY